MDYRRSDQSLTPFKRFDPSSMPSSSPRQRPRLADPITTSSNRIYFLLSFEKTDPVSQALYSVDASPPNDDEVNQPPSEKPIYPVFEFMPKDGYAETMCCITLDSNVYFLGGCIYKMGWRGLSSVSYSDKVYCINAANIPLNPTNPKLVLKEVAHMNTGKPSCYCFAAAGQLFAIGVSLWRVPPITPFEVYNPKENKWTPLPDPPFEMASVGCDAVVDNHTVILRTEELEYYTFNAVTHEWKDLRACCPFASCYSGVSRHAVFLDDTLYWGSNFNVISPGPTSRLDPAGKAEDFLSRLYRSASAELFDAITRYPIYNGPSTCLQYLGNRTFAYVVCGAFPDPQNPYDDDSPGDPKRSKAVIVFLEIPKEEGEEEGGKASRFFKVNILQTARFECRSIEADHTGIYLEGCFSDL